MAFQVSLKSLSVCAYAAGLQRDCYASLNIFILHTSVCFNALSVKTKYILVPQYTQMQTSQPQLTKLNAVRWIKIFCLGCSLQNKRPPVSVAQGTPNNRQYKTDTHMSLYLVYSVCTTVPCCCHE